MKTQAITPAQQRVIDAMRHHDKSELVINPQDREAYITYPLRSGGTWSMRAPYPTAAALIKNADVVYCDSQGHYKLLAEPSVEIEF